jgi:hypothetical protein
MMFFAIALAAITPSALTDAHQGDIACVAVQMTAELARADSIDTPLPRPVTSK